MKKSESIAKLAEALAKAQMEIRHALKDKSNPFFKSSYADLPAIWDAIRGPLTQNGLSIAQPLSIHPSGQTVLHTLLMHSSGEWIESEISVNPVKNDPQGLGSAITYMRRFSLSSMVGATADDDDDGESASGRGTEEKKTNPVKAAAGGVTPPPKVLPPKAGTPFDLQRQVVDLMSQLNWGKQEMKLFMQTHLQIDSIKSANPDQLTKLVKLMKSEKPLENPGKIEENNNNFEEFEKELHSLGSMHHIK